MDYVKLKKQEPRLADLEAMMKTFDRKSCTITFFCSEIKSPMLKIVGWGRSSDESDPLASSDAYDLVYTALCNMLPECPYNTCQSCAYAKAKATTDKKCH